MTVCLQFQIEFFYHILSIKQKHFGKTFMNSYQAKHVDQKLSNILHLKRMVTAKVLTLSLDNATRLDNHEKFLRYLKKESKEQRLTDIEIWIFGLGVFEDIDDLLRLCYFDFRLYKTDFECLFLKLKFNEEPKKKSKMDLEQIMSFQTKKQGSLLLKCKDNVLFEIRNHIQDFDTHTLLQKSIQLMKGLPYAKRFSQIQIKCLEEIMKEICRNYHIVPFHNFTHGFSVFLSFYCLSQLEIISSLLDDCSLFFCLIACLSHDIQHQGLNTLFEVKTNSTLSIEFGKFTIMEKMHLSKTLQILMKKQHTSKLFSSLPQEDRSQAKKIICKSILATDMSRHYQLVSAMSDKGIDKNSAGDRLTIVQALVHACDIQNPSLDFKSYMYWAHLVCIQFHDQTMKEKEWEVQVTQFLKFDTLSYFFKNQSNFANTIVYPLWKSLQTLFPSIEKREYCKRIKSNLLVLTDALRRNSEPILLSKPFQQYLSNSLHN